MCKNADNPCAECKKQKKTDAVWMFVTDEERHAIEPSNRTQPLVDAHC